MLRLPILAVALLLTTLVAVEDVVVSGGVTAAILLTVVVALMAGAGIVCTRAALRDSAAARISACLIGPALGFGVGVAALLGFWMAGVQSVWGLLLAPLAVCVLASLLRVTGGLDLLLPRFTRGDALAVMSVMLVVPVITFVPYAKVRHTVSDGEAYRAYFTADFVWGMAAAAEIAKGDVPPENPFHHNEPMRYYWLAHLLSGAEYRNFAPLGVRVESILLVNGLAFGLAFVAFVYWLARAVGATPMWAAVVTLVGFVANSYEGVDMVRAIVGHHDQWERLRDTNIDAVTRWFYKGMAVDGLHRLLLYQPHHLTGYALSLAALWLVVLAVDATAIAVALSVGILLALALLFSTFGALIVSVAAAGAYLLRLVQRGTHSLALQCAVLAGGPVVIGVLLTRAFGYTDPAAGLLMRFGPNPIALHEWPWVMFLSFGPLLLWGLPALARPQWLRGAGAAPAALAISALAFYFLVDVPDMGGVWVGWRSGHMLLIALATAAGAGVTALWTFAENKWAVAVVGVVAIILALPTVAIDVFNAQDIDNRHDAAGFPWTLIVTPAEREGFDWIRANTPPDAVIQSEPFVRDPETWAYIPAFAERRMAAGLPISMIPRRHYVSASNDVRNGIFLANSAEDAYGWAEMLGLDYVLIGDRERHNYGPQVSRMMQRRDLYETVFRNDAILLLKVRQRERVAAHHE